MQMHVVLGAQQVPAPGSRVVGVIVRVRGRSAGCGEPRVRRASGEALASDPWRCASICTGRPDFNELHVTVPAQ